MAIKHAHSFFKKYFCNTPLFDFIVMYSVNSILLDIYVPLSFSGYKQWLLYVYIFAHLS